MDLDNEYLEELAKDSGLMLSDNLIEFAEKVAMYAEDCVHCPDMNQHPGIGH